MLLAFSVVMLRIITLLVFSVVIFRIITLLIFWVANYHAHSILGCELSRSFQFRLRIITRDNWRKIVVNPARQTSKPSNFGDFSYDKVTI